MSEYLSIGEPMSPINRILLSQLSVHEVHVICNGCGPKGGYAIQLALPKEVFSWKKRLLIPIPQWHSENTCNQHDIDYWVGGTESDRKEADQQLLWGLKRDAKVKVEYWRDTFWSLCMYVPKMIQAHVYYLAVRYSRIARKHFHYSISSQCRYRTLDQLRAYTNTQKD